MTQGSLFDDSESTGALFDADRKYRYLLWRRWAPGAPLLWIMLNPSTADETELDPTLLSAWGRGLGYQGQWGIALGADGLMVEVHPDPARALSDGPQSLTPPNFADMMKQLRAIGQAVGIAL